jgi:guanosine-3',5'-bis(diphosphate) 3'-pyrophosphohydrolase
MEISESRYNDDGNLVVAARLFAIKAHGDQRYGDEPFVFHLDAVVRVIDSYGHTDPEVRASGYLHDVVEDTDKTKEDIAAEFSSSIAEIVHAVSSEPGKNRKERNIATYPKIRAVHKAVIVKLSDRIANVGYSLATKSDLFTMYQREYPAFRAALYYDSPDLTKMWEFLDRIM